MYSGPEPPSGGVSRPPFAVIAPHWTQFDGVISTVTMPVAHVATDLVHVRGAHPLPRLGDGATHGRPQLQVVRLVVARPVPRREDRRELVEEVRAVGSGIAGRTARLLQRGGRIRMRREAAVGGTPLRHGHHAREPTADEEALVERLPHVAHLVELLHVRARAQGLVVRVEGPEAARYLAALQRPKRCLRGEPARLDRVVDALQPRHVDEPGALTDEQQARRVEPRRQRVVAALRDRLRPPRDRSPPPRILQTSRCVLNSCRTSCTENSTSEASSPATKPTVTRSSPIG